MRVLLLVGLLAVAQPAFAQAQVAADGAGAPEESTQTSSAPLHLTQVAQIPVGPMRGNASLYCCSRHGAVVGAAIGAGLGLALTYYFDDSGDRSTHFFTTAAFLGGIGAGIGTITGASSVTRPRVFPVGKRLGVGPVIAKDK